MHYATRIEVADAETVWSVLADLSGWPSWTPTFEKVTPAGAEPVEGQRVTVKQPGRRAVVYTIERVDPGHSFRWGAQSVGCYQWADHVIARQPSGTAVVELSFSMTGWIGRLTALLGGRIIRRMVDTEASSLRHRVEVAHS